VSIRPTFWSKVTPMEGFPLTTHYRVSGRASWVPAAESEAELWLKTDFSAFQVSKCRFVEGDCLAPLMCWLSECPANRYVFRSRLNCSVSTAGSCRWSDSEFHSRLWVRRQKCTSPEGAKAYSRNWQLMISGKSQMLATKNFGDWHTAVDEVPWS